MVTSHQVAKLAGVSQPTVSRALRDSPKVSAQTKLKVRAAAEALGYVPSDAGRALASGRTHRIGLLVTDLANQFYQYLIAPMHDELDSLGYQLVLVTESVDQVVDRLPASGLDAVILATTTVDSVLPVRLRDRGMPFVYFNRTSDLVPADAVVVRSDQGIGEAVHQIIALGHERVGAIFGPENTSTGRRRGEGLRAALAAAGVPFDPGLGFKGQFAFETGVEAVRVLLAGRTRPTVLVCANDVMAFGALNAARERGIQVPAELSVVGFDDLPVAGWPLVRLTTVAYDLNAMARAAVGLMVDRLAQGPGAPYRQTDFGSRLVLRDTLGPAPR
ncbi:MAG: LacI family DNA-binding transcriptional regulator [Propionibacteriaceae bacterium]